MHGVAILAWVAVAGGVATSAHGAPSAYAKIWSRSLAGQRVYLADGRSVRTTAPFVHHELSVYAEARFPSGWGLALFSGLGAFSRVGDAERWTLGPTTGELRRRLVDSDTKVWAHLRGLLNPSLVAAALPLSTASGAPLRFLAQAGTLGLAGGLRAEGRLGPMWWSGYGELEGYTRSGKYPALLASLGAGTRIGRFAPELRAHFAWAFGLGPVVDALGRVNTRYFGLGAALSYWFVDVAAVQLGVETAFYVRANAAVPVYTVGLEFRAG